MVEVPGREEGETFPLEMSLSAIELPDGVGFLGAIRDVTERLRLQGRIVQAEKLASLGVLSAGLAHEINNPLAYVTNNLAVLERDFRGLAWCWRPMKRPGRSWRLSIPSSPNGSPGSWWRTTFPTSRRTSARSSRARGKGQAGLRHRAEPARVCPARPGSHRPVGPECGDRPLPGADPGPDGTHQISVVLNLGEILRSSAPRPDQPGDPEPSAQCQQAIEETDGRRSN